MLCYGFHSWRDFKMEYTKSLDPHKLRKERVVYVCVMKEPWISEHSIMIRSLKRHPSREFNSIQFDWSTANSFTELTVWWNELYKYGRGAMEWDEMANNCAVCAQLVFLKNILTHSFERSVRLWWNFNVWPSVWFRINYCRTNRVKISQWTEQKLHVCAVYTVSSTRRQHECFVHTSP